MKNIIKIENTEYIKLSKYKELEKKKARMKMSKLKGIGNKIIQISEVQDGRFWIHSFELGFGKWVYNLELLKIIKEKASHSTVEVKKG